jgi:hypothetical protein
MLDGNYVVLKNEPEVPLNQCPTRKDCDGFEYMTMVQLCNITESKGLGRSKSCNAFGGDKGKKEVLSVRKARIFGERKFVLVSAVIDYLAEQGINW